LNPEDILDWPRNKKIGIVWCKSDEKEYKAYWKDVDFNTIDYESNVKNGIYNQGIALVLRKCLEPFSDHYAFALDFDGWPAVAAFFGYPGDIEDQIWERVIEYSQKHRVEWHKNKGRLHVIFYANKLVDSRKLTVNDSGLECRSNELLTCSPSISIDGNAWEVLGTTEISTLDNIQIFELMARLSSIADNYTSDDSYVSERVKWLEDINNWKSIGVGEGRHNALVTLGTSYFYRYSGEWKELTDDQRYEKLLERNSQFTVPKEEKEVESIWDWIIKTHRVNRDRQREEWEQRQSKYNKYDSPGCVSYKIGKNRYIIGTIDNQIAEAKVEDKNKDKFDENSNPLVRDLQFAVTKIIAACKPVKIVKDGNPVSNYIELEQRYTITFRGSQPSGNFTVKKQTLGEIASRLKDGMALVDRGIETALAAQILGFEERGMLESDNELPFTGFLLSNDGNILTNNLDIKQEIDKIELKNALEIINQITKFYENDLDLLATILKWAMIAPLSFVIKCINRVKFLKFLHFHGIGRTGKTTSEEIALAIDAHHADSKFVLSINDIDTPARLGSAMSDTTFPKLVDEVTLSTQDQTRYVLRDLKIAIDHINVRSKFPHGRSSRAIPIPALSPFAINSNGDLPNDAAYVRRVIDKSFSQSEAHPESADKTKEFRLFAQTNFAKLAPIGAFRNWLVMNNQDSIFRAINDVNIDTFTIGKNFWIYAYEYVGLTAPEWLDKMLAIDQFENSIADTEVSVLNGFQSLINTCLKNFTGTKHFDNQEDKEGAIIHALNMQERLKMVVESTLLPCIKEQKTTDKYMIDKGILQELYKHGVTHDQLPNLKAFAEYLHIEYSKYGKKVMAKGSLSDIAKNFDLEEES